MKKKHLLISALPDSTVLYSEANLISGVIGGAKYQTTNVFNVTVKDCRENNILPLNITEQQARNMLTELYNV